MKSKKINFIILLMTFCVNQSCQKIEYTEINNPAYLRVFNSLNLLNIKNSTVVDSLPYLCMLINPTFDNEGNPNGAEIIGDHLDVRSHYAPPYPAHIGTSTSKINPEYPGKEAVLAGPVLNGFDLSSWAQVPSGSLHIVFMYRPKNDISFFDLQKDFRINKVAEDRINLSSGEVYTLQVVYDNFDARSRKILLRTEDFHKKSFSDSLVYVNFYNYSAEGFYAADKQEKVASGKGIEHLFEEGVKDVMDIYLTIWDDQNFIMYQNGVILRDQIKSSPFYNRKYFYTVRRDLNSKTVAQYVSFPIHVFGDVENQVFTNSWQQFEFLSSQLHISENSNSFDGNGDYGNFMFDHGGSYHSPKGNYAILNCLLNGKRIYKDVNHMYKIHMGLGVPNLIINTHSGYDNPKSFSSVNSVEIINGQVYLSTQQRKYLPPIY